MEKSELIKEMIKDGLIEQRVRVQIYPTHSYIPNDLKKIYKKYGITEQEFDELLRTDSHHSDKESSYKEVFGFYTFEKPFDELEFIYSEGSILDLGNPEVEKLVRKEFAKKKKKK